MPKWIQYVIAGFALVIVGGLVVNTYTSITGASSDAERQADELRESLDGLGDE